MARVRAATGEVVVMEEPVEYDPDHLLSGAECGQLVGVSAKSWRAMVSRGYAPKADDPDDADGRPPARRNPRWRAETIRVFRATRPSASWKRKPRDTPS